MVTGEKEIDKANYYFVDSGAMAVGWKWHDEGIITIKQAVQC